MFRRKHKQEPDSMDLSASKPDPSDPHNHIIFINLVLMGLVAFFGACLVIGVIFFYLLAGKAPRTIILNHDSLEPPQVFVGTESHTFSKADARIFFINMVKLRYGWSSTTLARDTTALMGFSAEVQRTADSQYWSEIIEIPGAPHIKKARLAAWTDMGIRQHLILPTSMEAILCESEPKAATWGCAMRIKQVTDFLAGPGQEQEFVVFGTMLEATHSVANPYGMLLKHMKTSSVPSEGGKT